MEGRAIAAAAVIALLLGIGGIWSAMRFDELNVVDSAPDLSTAAAGSPAAAPPLDATTTTSPANTTTPSSPAPVSPCAVGDEPTVGDPATDWATIVVDAQLALPSDFVPPDLVDAAEAGFDTGDQIRRIIVDDLDALRRAAEENGTPLGLISAYRSYSYQSGLFDRAVEEQGEAAAVTDTARPGHSEHQLGTVVDLLAAGSQDLSASFAETETGQWLAQNATTYGFVFSYPDLPRERTCYEHEPWHLRYVGRDLAPTIAESGMAPREWMLSQVQAR